MKKTNDVSRLAGVSRRTLQYYDDEGLLPVERSSQNYRLYSEADLEQIYSDTCLSISFLRFLSEEERSDIFTSAEKKTGAQSDILVENSIAPDQGKNQGKTAGIPDRLNIRIGDKLTVSHKTACNNSDRWLHIILLLPGIFQYTRICKKEPVYSYPARRDVYDIAEEKLFCMQSQEKDHLKGGL